MAFRAQPDKQQVASFDCPSEIGDGDFVATFPAPHVGKQLLLAVGGNALPQFCGRAGEFRNGLAAHGLSLVLCLPDAEKLKIKSGLVIEITRAIRTLGLTQEAGRRMALPQPKVSAMQRGDFANLSERKLMDCLNRLGYDIEIKPTRRPVGYLRLAIA